MNKALLLSCFFLIFQISLSWSQGVEYEVVKSKGDLPEDFLTLSDENFSRAAARHIQKSDRRKTTRYKETFLTKSNWFINRMLRSGSVMFNDSISEYVKDVADIVLADYPHIRDELRFYTARHSSVNAFSTDAGVIIFNTGLIAQLENEAQLAFVIAHEVVHFYKKHGITGYLEERMVADEYSNLDNWTIEQHLYLAKNHRSREMETEADKMGFEKFFKTTAYDQNAALGVMDVLQYAYLPFNDIPFSHSFLTNRYFSFPDEYLLEELNAISTGDDYDDDLSTHPSVRKRREELKDLIRLENQKQGERFIISHDRFMRIRKLARYETVRQHMLNKDYPRAVYDAYVMMQDNPNDPFLQRVVAGALYGLSLYKSKDSDRTVVADYDDIEGKSQQVYYLMDEMSDEWASVVALQYAWRLHKRFPGDRYYQAITTELFRNMVKEEKLHPDGFYALTKDSLLSQTDTASVDTTKSLSKYDRIRENSLKSQLTRGEEEYRFAFVDMLQDPDFVEAFRDAEDFVKEQDEKEEIGYDAIQKKLEEEKQTAIAERSGYKIGVNKVFLVDPLFLSVNEKKEEVIQYFQTEDRKIEMSRTVKQMGDDLNMTVEMMDPWLLTVGDVEKYNDIVLLKDWMNEYFNHGDFKIIPFASKDIYPIMEEYDIQHLNWMGAITGRVKDNASVWRGCLYLYVGLVPLAVYEWAKPSYQMIFVSTLVDLEEAQARFSYRYAIDKRGGKFRLQNRIYDILNQINTEE